MFHDRKDAGQKLARALKKYKDEYKGQSGQILVLAIPRGGVEIGYEVAKYLGADFDLLVSRKLPYPDNPEAGFGAIAEDGSIYIVKSLESELPSEMVTRVIKDQGSEIKRRIRVLREGKPLPQIKGKIIILVDDGIAVGSTMRAAIKLCKNKEAEKIIVAAPVSGPRIAKEMANLADEAVILETPEYFSAVAQVYEKWHDVSDDEVLNLMAKFRKS